jgi:hypothetical protein
MQTFSITYSVTRLYQLLLVVDVVYHELCEGEQRLTWAVSGVRS